MVLRFGEKKRRVLVDDGMVVLDVLRDNAPSSIPLDRLTARLDGVEVSRSMRLSVLLERMGADGETEPELELVERVGDGW
jgi:DNA-binding response OmpR family regulator